MEVTGNVADVNKKILCDNSYAFLAQDLIIHIRRQNSEKCHGLLKLLINARDPRKTKGKYFLFNKTIKHSVVNTGLVSKGASITSWGEGASLVLVGQPFSDGVTIKMPYVVDVLYRPVSHPDLFLLGWLKVNLDLLLDQLRLA